MKLLHNYNTQGRIVQDELQKIYKLLNGDQSDRNDSGLCGDVEKNTYWTRKFRKRIEEIDKNTDFRNTLETRKDKIWIAVVISWILAIMSFFQDKILGYLCPALNSLPRIKPSHIPPCWLEDCRA